MLYELDKSKNQQYRKYSFGRIMKIGQDANPSTALKQEKGALRINPCLRLVV
jgi:hypothetical protein